LEQEKSNLANEVFNLENQLKVMKSVEYHNSRVDIKGSAATELGGRSEVSRSEYSRQSERQFTSPVSRIAGSPKEDDLDIKMVKSKIEPSSSGTATISRPPTYDLAESQHSETSVGREQPSTYGTGAQQVTSAYQTPAGSSISGSSQYGGRSEISQTGLATSTYEVQKGQRSTYQSSAQQGATYQPSGSGIYQSGTSSSGIYQAGERSGTSRASETSGSAIYQSGERSGTYTPGTTYQAGTGDRAGSAYQPYQGGYSYQSSNYRSGQSGSGVGQPQQGQTQGQTGQSGQPGQPGQPGSGQYGSSGYTRFDKK
jgi:hypothetical protein